MKKNLSREINPIVDSLGSNFFVVRQQQVDLDLLVHEVTRIYLFVFLYPLSVVDTVDAFIAHRV